MCLHILRPGTLIRDSIAVIIIGNTVVSSSGGQHTAAFRWNISNASCNPSAHGIHELTLICKPFVNLHANQDYVWTHPVKLTRKRDDRASSLRILCFAMKIFEILPSPFPQMYCDKAALFHLDIVCLCMCSTLSRCLSDYSRCVITIVLHRNVYRVNLSMMRNYNNDRWD